MAALKRGGIVVSATYVQHFDDFCPPLINRSCLCPRSRAARRYDEHQFAAGALVRVQTEIRLALELMRIRVADAACQAGSTMQSRSSAAIFNGD